MEYQIQVDPNVYNETYKKLVRDETRTQIIYGGSSSGKSFFLIGQRLILDLLKGGRNYLCIRNVARTLRESVFNEAVKGIGNMQVGELFNINKTDMTLTCSNGYQAIMKGLDDVDKIKSITPVKGVITDILIEEATETAENDIKQLIRRLRGRTDTKKRITLIFNPIFRTHWIYKKYFAGSWKDDDTYFKNDDLLILKTTYKDNLRFLEADDIKELENEKDKYWYDVFTLGKWGVLGDLVFTNWTVEDLLHTRDKMGMYYNGLDFGYANDVAAGSRSAIKDKTLYITHELVYERGLTNDVLAQKLGSQIGQECIRCDSSAPKDIAELRQFGLRGAMGATKGAGSVLFGIQHLQQYQIIIDKQCQNAINEFQLYQWEKDKEGNTINKPIDKNNHFLDATRYAHDGNMRVASTTIDSKDSLGIF